MSGTDHQPHVIGFVCNWGAYGGVEMAGVHQIEYPASLRLIRVACLGRVHLGLILKAFEMGAHGVAVLGCPPEECHYDSGEKIREMVRQAKRVLRLLGIAPGRFELIEVPLGQGDVFARQVGAFVKRVSAAAGTSISAAVKE